GGGGWGNPLERDPELVALEIRQGLVTVQGARDYGVVIADDGTVDASATESLRTEMAQNVVETDGPFNFGPDIETLRANCLEETGLPAPIQPGTVAA
ncbi:MAG: hydantoinase B/oxoprolinase family protein, partial [Parasphingorhabdus sp.]